MSRVDVSVIIPVYNTGASAKKLIKKILGSFDDLEIIVVDDGSTDDSRDLLKAIGDKRVKYLVRRTVVRLVRGILGLKKQRENTYCL